jgi:hypothetical protein
VFPTSQGTQERQKRTVNRPPLHLPLRCFSLSPEEGTESNTDHIH